MDKPAAIQEIKTAATTFFEAGLSYGLNLATALILLAAGFTFAGWASRWIRQRLAAVEHFDQTLVPVVAQIGRYSILILTLVLVLSEFGVQTASIIAVLGAAGLAIGLALQGALSNVAAGIMLLVIRPIRVGDYVEAAGEAGTIDEIGLFMTRMHTPQGVFVAIPNAKIFGNTITNYAMRPRRRLDLGVGISYDDDIDAAVVILKQLADAETRFYKKPAPVVLVKSLGDSSVNLEIRGWAKRQQFWDVQRDMVRSVKYALDEAGISIPYPHRQIVLSGELPFAATASDGKSGAKRSGTRK